MSEFIGALTGPAASVQSKSNTSKEVLATQSLQPSPPDLDRLASALSVLDPDRDEYTWKFHRIAPLANTALEFPELKQPLYDLAMAWSRGDLQSEPSKAWVTPGGNGISGKDIFDSVWDRFYKSSYTGRKTTLGTIFFAAQSEGWVAPETAVHSTEQEEE